MTKWNNLWLRDLERHPDGEVRLYVGGRLVSGTPAAQVVSALNELVVLDPDDAEQVQRLMEEYYRDINGQQVRPESALVQTMQAALRSFIAPPRPAEPRNLGAVVEDKHGDKWVWMANGADGPHWTRVGVVTSRRHYDAIEVVRVLSEGVQ